MKKQHKKVLGLVILMTFLSSVNLLNNFIPLSKDIDENIISEEEKIQIGGHPYKDELIFGTRLGPEDLDPLNAWDSASYDVIMQVAEGLYMIDYSNPELPRIPMLAVDDGAWINSKCWEVNLRQNVYFHDGTQLKATNIKWNFDRMAYFMNSSAIPLLNETIMNTFPLFQANDGIPIINRTEVRSEYRIRFYLNTEFSPLLDLFTCPSSYIVSPSSTPRWNYIDTETGDLVGTGPYVYDNYTTGVEVLFHAWDRYWREPAQIQNLTFSVIDDETVRNELMLNGSIDVLSEPSVDLMSNFTANSNLSVIDNGPGMSYYYLGMNNKRINATWREAISFAINYTQIIEELMNNTVTRAYSPLSPSFFPGWDQSAELNTPILNVTKAREVLQANGIGVGLTSDAAWQAANLASFNYSYYTGHQFRTELYSLLRDNLDLIGITVEDAAMTWEEYFYMAYGITPGGYDRLELYWVGWGPDYLSPHNILYPLFANESVYNSAQVNDPVVQNLFSQALSEVDVNARNDIYKQLLGELTGRIYPHVFGFHPIVYDVYSNKLVGFPSNVIGRFYFYPCHWEYIRRGAPYKESLKFGTSRGPEALDPLNAWDSASYDVFMQVAEGLYMYEYSDPDVPRIPMLAVDDGKWINNTCWEVDLRQEVIFHDGTQFNATAVKWNFDRMTYFMNSSAIPLLNETLMTPQSLFQLNDGTPIINRTEVINEYKIRFYLNSEFSPFLELLACPSSYIVSPSSTPRWNYINVTSGDLIGTGPYIYDNYTQDVEVQFHKWNQYWRDPAQIQNLIFKVIEDPLKRSKAILNRTIDVLNEPMTSLFSNYTADYNLTFSNIGPGMSYFYLGMNNERINATWREAISHAIDYNYIIEVLNDGTALRAYSPLAPSFLPGWDQSTELNTPIFNISKAREILQTAGIGVGLTSDAEWQAANLATFNYSYNTENQFRTELYTLLRDNLDLIGITVEDGAMTWEEYIYMAYGITPGGYKRLELYWVGWGSDYKSPYNMLYPLFANESFQNSAQVNDPVLQDLFSQILSQNNEFMRMELYKQFVEELTGRIYPHVFGIHPNVYYIYNNKLHGFPCNPLNIYYFYPCYWEYIEVGNPFKNELVVGTSLGPVDLDPLNAWDSGSYDVIMQVAEGLYMNDYSDPELSRIPMLAVNDGEWINSTCWEVELKQNIYFHDGTSFNATAVKWNFDRMAYFMNTTGTLPANQEIMRTQSLFLLRDGAPIIDSTEVLGEYRIRFNLNSEFSPLLELFTCPSSYILSPSSTPRWNYINTTSGDLVGTGPYEYDNYTQEVEVQFRAWNQYWREPAQINTLKFKVVQDAIDRNDAMLARDFDFLRDPMESYLQDFSLNPNINVRNIGTGMTYFYLGMNNERLNTTWREAISHAIDYNYIIEVLNDGTALRAYSPLAPSFLPGWDQSTELNTPIFNISKAREILQTAGIGVGLTSDAEWQAANLATFNYSYNIENQFRTELYPLLRDNLDLIGITVEDGAMTWEEYLYIAYGFEPWGYDRLELYWVGWGPDYKSPYNMLYPLFDNQSSYNSAQVNDPVIQDLFLQALSEVDVNARNDIYKQLLGELTGRIYPHVFGIHPILFDVYDSKLHGYPFNTLNHLYFYPCYWEIVDYSLEISEPTDFSYIAGNGGNNITWTISAENISGCNYYIYKDSVLNQSGLWTPNNTIVIDVDGLSNGTYEYRLEMHHDSLVVKDHVLVTVNPNYSMVISHPDNYSYVAGNSGNNISWTVSALNTLNPMYYIYKDTVLNQSNTWSSGIPIFIDVDGLSNGTYEYHIEVHNDNGNEIIEDNVTIIVYPNYSMTISRPEDFSYEVGSSGNNITWTVFASNVLNPMYYIYKDAVFNQSNTWSSGNPIVINIDGLEVGTHEYHIEVYNDNGNEIIEDNVTIIVNPLNYSMTISRPEDFSYNVESTGNNISWVVSASSVLNPVYYIYKDTILEQNNTWSSGTPIVINIDGLAVGTHVYRIEVHNNNGNEIIEDIVLITVNILSTVLNPITPNPDFDGIIELSWSVVVNASNYLVYRSKSNILSVDSLTPIVITSNTNYDDNITINGIYYYAIIAECATGYSDISNCEDVIIVIGLISENLTSGTQGIEIDPAGISDFLINIAFDLNDSVQFFYSCFGENPINETLEEALFFIELIISDVDQLIGTLNFTIEYNGSINYDDFGVLWFNESANGGIGEWQEIEITVDGNTISFSVSHASIFALTGVVNVAGDVVQPIIIIIIIIIIGSITTVSAGSIYVIQKSTVSKKIRSKFGKKTKLGAIKEESQELLLEKRGEIKPKKKTSEKTAKKKKSQVQPAKMKTAVDTSVITEKEKEEIKKTESEVDIQKEKFTCIVHRGDIVGTIYLCPNCQTIYCQKCAKVLKDNGEKCWSCNEDIDISD